MPNVDDGQVDDSAGGRTGSSTDPRPEVKAAAKAITMLADDLNAARSQLLEERMIREALESQDEKDASELEHDLRSRLRARLARAKKA